MGIPSARTEMAPGASPAPKACRCKKIDPASADERVLILTSRPRDADTLCNLLMAAGIGCYIAADLADIASAIDAGAAAAIVTEGALAAADRAPVHDWLQQQSSWSDFPFVVLAGRQTGRRNELAERVAGLGNVVMLERPLNGESLISAVTSALRARRRQYQSRAQLAAQKQAEERLKFALEGGRMGTWDLDVATGTLSTSDTCKRIFGRQTGDDFTYDHLVEAIHPEDRGRQHEAVRQSLKSHEDFDIEYRIIWPDGRLHWVYVRGGRKGDMRSVRLTGVALDITERKRAEAELRQLNETLESRIAERTAQLSETNERLVAEIGEREKAQAAFVQAQKMEAIGHLTGGIAHDFNNLLTAIHGNVELIGRRTADERIQRMAGYARDAVARAAKLTSQLLAFSRNQNLVLKPVDIDQLIRNMDDLLSRSLGHTIRIETDLAARDAMATADANQLELAILNLAINSRDAMPEGGVLTIVSRIETDWGEDLKPGRYIVISVSDTGTGIEPELLSKVFDPFFTTKSVGKGTGLGLSQVYGIAQQSGGTTRVQSELGKGTTIEIWLPLVTGAHAEQVVHMAVEAVLRGHHEKVLVIDDDPDVRRFIVQCLETLDYDVTQAEHGEAGLARLDADRPKLLIVDFAMPGLNGAAVAAEARRRRPGLPVILVTGYADTKAVECVVGADSILRKPFKVEDLASSMRRALA
ncbi:MAG TPA: response regulator [Alphaproteobacteria bacterium]|nr:response regulator [Alphaproteobacteria bacterium]